MRIDAGYREFLVSDGPLKYLVRKLEEMKAFRSTPSIEALLSVARGSSGARHMEEIDEAIRQFLSTDTSFVLESLKKWILEAVADDKALPPFRDAIEYDEGLFHNVNILKRDGISITASSISGQDIVASRERGVGTRVVFSGQRVFFKFLKADNAVVTIWECDPFSDASEFGALRCTGSRDVRVSAGDTLELDGTCESLSFGSCESTAVFLQVENVVRDVGTSVAFHRETGAFMETYPTDRTALRRMVMCSALKHMGASSRLATLPAPAREGPFYLRWHFARETVAAAPERSVALLESLAEDDASPTVRRAASATLTMLAKRRA